jgi:hypothetical protein
MVHRDIKPSNILVGPTGEVKLADLGLAKEVARQTTQLTQTGQLLGTPQYMSPEQLLEAKDVDIRSDIYALGVTLFELIEGRPPFGGTLSDVVRQHIAPERPSLSASVSPAGAQDLVTEMMAVDADARPQTPADVVERVDALLANLGRLETADTLFSEDEPAPPPPPTEVLPAVPPARAAPTLVEESPRGTRWWIPVAVVAVVGGAGVVGALLLREEEPPGEEERGPEPELHAHVEPLDGGRVRIHYDFEDPAQLRDWRLLIPDQSRMRISRGRLHLQWTGVGDEELAVAVLDRPIRADVLELSAEVISGDHINWYLQTEWPPVEWCPPHAFAGIFRAGRVFCVDGENTEDQPPEVEERHVYRMRVEVHEDRLLWHVDGLEPIDHPIEPHRAPDRMLGIGTWSSHVAFDDIIIEGELGD